MQTEEIEVEEERVQGLTLLENARKFAITDQTGLEAAGASLQHVVGLRKGIAAKFKEPIDAAHKAHKSMLALRDEIDAPFKMAESEFRSKTQIYLSLREAERQAEIRRIEAEQRKLEEARQAEIRKRENEERARLEAIREAERKRLYAEGKRKEAAAVAAKAVEVVIDEPPEYNMPVVLPPEPPKVKGLSQTKRYAFEVDDEDKIPDQYWVIDEKTIQALVLKLGPTAAKAVPGIRVFEVTGLSVRG